MATLGDEIWVAGGVYREHVTISDGISLYGGFAGSETVRDARDAAANETIVSPTWGDILTITGTTPYAPNVVDGFTFSRASADQAGRGLAIAGATVLISHCTISGNRGNYGGGLWMSRARVTIEDSVISGNSAKYGGGGLYAVNDGVGYGLPGMLIVRRTEFSDNTVPEGSRGGAIGANGPEMHVTGCLFTRNAASSGGAICNGWSTAAYSPVRLVGNVFVGNSAIGSDTGGGYGYGGAIQGSNYVLIAGNLLAENTAFAGGAMFASGIRAVSIVVTTNNTIVGNHSTSGGAVLEAPYGSLFANNVVAFNSAGVERNSWNETPGTYRNNCVFGNAAFNYKVVTAGTGDISLDPLFADREQGDYHLLPGSPCIDAGDRSVVENGWLDLDGGPRISGSGVDIGAYEFDQGTPGFTLLDVLEALRLAGGVLTAGESAMRLDVDNAMPAAVSLADAALLARIVAGLGSGP